MPPLIEMLLGGRVSRQMFLNGIVVGYGAIAGLVLSIPLVGFFLTPLIKGEPRIWRDLGPVDKYKVGETVEVKFRDPSSLAWAGDTALAAAWLRRESAASFTAYSIYCTHLGCPVHWVSTAQLFLCPCHGSAFYADGAVAAGPAQIPLVRYKVRTRGGRLEIQTRPIPVIG